MNAVSFFHTSTTKPYSGILTTTRMRNLVIGLLFLTVLSPIFLYTDMLSASFTPYSSKQEDVNAFTLPSDTRHLNVLPQEESSTVIKEPIGIVYTDHTNPSSNTNLTQKDLQLPDAREHKYARVLSATDEKGHSQTDNIIKQVIQTTNQEEEEEEESQKDNGSDRESHQKTTQDQLEQQSAVNSGKDDEKDAPIAETNKQTDQTAMPDARVRQFRDQLIRARVYLSLPATKNNPHFTRELRMRVKEVQRVLVDATKDSDLPKNAYAKLNAMDQLLEKGKQMQDDCATMVKKLRAMLQSTEEQLRVHKKQTMFLTQLTAKTLPKGLHCLPLRLTTEYYNLNSTKQQFPNQEKVG
ncbi:HEXOSYLTRANSFERASE [Salix purpurea]|uniref:HEXOSYLTRANSFERASE n=1 Tax=Salix purpurea TaxID=77065 RepID=A0A9Q0W040_SALPP|nr:HEXOSYLTRANSFERASE [Salix purpurea]